MKGNPFFGTMRGKLGEQVFSRTGGEQRARTYLKVISNPRTKAQMSQRVKLANLVGFYRLLRPLLGDSFLRRPANQSSYNAFIKANLAASEVYLTKQQASSGYVVTAPYTITDGTLQSSGWIAEGSTYTTPFEGTAGSGYTLQDGFKTAYMQYYPDANESDVLLFVSVLEQSSAVAPTMSVHAMYLSLLDGTDKWFAANIKSLKPAEASSNAPFVYTAKNNESLAIVRARITDNKIVICSTEYLHIQGAANLRLGQFDTKLALNNAINSYGLGSDFLIQSAVRDVPTKVGVKANWVMENGTLSESIVFDKPGSVNPRTAIAYFTGVGGRADFDSTEFLFSNIEMSGLGSEITAKSIKYSDDGTSLTIEFESMVVASSYSSYPVTTDVYIRLLDKDGRAVFEHNTAPLTFNAKA